MPVFGDQEYPEDIRLSTRFLDLRRDKLHNNIIKRGQIIDSIRRRMKEEGFFEFQTPILTASSPEGARDFLVPSRLHPGKFYALPAGPAAVQAAHHDRGLSTAISRSRPCFRDEDARADRSPGEFYQLDVEMSFVTQDDVFGAVEPVMRGVFEEFAGGKPVTQKFPLIPFAEALRKYGSDKPDLRNPIRCRTSPSISAAPASRCSRDAGGPEEPGLGDPGTGRRLARVLRPHELLGAGRGPAGLGYIMWREGGEGAGPLPTTSARSGPLRSATARLKEGDAASSSPAIPTNSGSLPACRAPSSARS
jgi:aspartyl-tRNA synthetase